MRRIEIAACLAVLFLALSAVPVLADATTVTDVHDFTGTGGAVPYGNVIQGADGNLYGVTSSGSPEPGTVFTCKTDGTSFSTLHTFATTDGAAPNAGLVQGSDGFLYGTTTGGGSDSDGTVFKVSTDGSTFTTLHNFAGGTTDGDDPGGLIQGADGNFYGTTDTGGANGAGTIFKISADGSTYSVIYSFDNTTAAAPQGALVQAPDGTLYGTTLWTVYGDTSTDGTVYKINTDGTGFTVLHTFTGSTTDGQNPGAGLIIGDDGDLYGTTRGGGVNSDGIAYKIGVDGSGFTILHSFGGTDGNFPDCPLVIGQDGNLYGTTEEGGSFGNGTLFAVAPDGSSFTSLYSFSVTGATDGDHPQSGLTAGTDGNFYGTCTGGGDNGDGDVIQLSTGLPASPTNLSFVAGNVQLAVTWHSVVGATSYKVYRGTTAGGEAAAAVATVTNPTYTDTGLMPATTYYYEVTAVVSGTESAKSAEASAATLTPATLHTFQAGLQMISAPTDDTGDTVAQIFGNSSAELAVYDAANGSYVTTPTAPANTIVPAQGYWFKPTSNAPMYDIGTDTVAGDSYQVTLTPGWNIIGNPQSVVYPVSSLEVQSGSNQPVTFAAANLDGLVADTFYTYQVGDTAYEVLPASGANLAAYEGYWLYAFQTCTLIFPALN